MFSIFKISGFAAEQMAELRRHHTNIWSAINMNAQEIKAVTAQLKKIGEESTKTLEKVEELQAQIDNLPTNSIPQDVLDAFEELKAQVKTVDDLVADAPAPAPEPQPEPEVPTDPAPADPAQEGPAATDNPELKA